MISHCSYQRIYMSVQNWLSFFTRKALHILAPFCPLIGICQTAFENTFDCHIINIHSVSFCLGMQFDFQHKAIISSSFCVVLHRAMSQCIIMTVQHCEECKHSPASLSKQLHCISKVESPFLDKQISSSNKRAAWL